MSSFVYFMGCANGKGPIKIGCSRVPLGRLENIAAWSPVPLVMLAQMPGDTSLEFAFHARFAHLYSHREWFRRTPELEAVVAEVAAGTFDTSTLPPPKRVCHPRTYRTWTDAERYRAKIRRRVQQVRWQIGGLPAPVYNALYDWSFDDAGKPDCAERRVLEDFLRQHAIGLPEAAKPSHPTISAPTNRRAA